MPTTSHSDETQRTHDHGDDFGVACLLALGGHSGCHVGTHLRDQNVFCQHLAVHHLLTLDAAVLVGQGGKPIGCPLRNVLVQCSPEVVSLGRRIYSGLLVRLLTLF